MTERGIPAEVVQIMGNLGIRGVRRIRCRVLEGADKNKILIRNVVGPVNVGDIIMLKETSMDSEGKLQRKG